MMISVRGEQLLRRAIAHYGRAQQLVKCIEEMNELIHEICRCFERDERGIDPSHIAEELADVSIVLDQARLILEIDPYEEYAQRRRKLRRLEARLDAAQGAEAAER